MLFVVKKKGLKNKEFIEKEYFQNLILSNIYSYSNFLVFKRGTALYKIYSLPRFSEDLDFSVLGDVKIKEIEKVIETTARKCKMKIKYKRKVKNSILFKLAFKGILTKSNTF